MDEGKSLLGRVVLFGETVRLMNGAASPCRSLGGVTPAMSTALGRNLGVQFKNIARRNPLGARSRHGLGDYSEVLQSAVNAGARASLTASDRLHR